MRWSQQRKQIKLLICPELRKRIDFHVTCYREAHDHVGEAWITIDGEKVFGASFYEWWKAFDKALEQTQEHSTLSGPLAIHTGSHFQTFTPITEQLVLDQEVYETGYFLESLKSYLETALEEALRSSNHLIRAFAMVDRRLGKRRFAKIEIKDSDPNIVKLFYVLRAHVI